MVYRLSNYKNHNNNNCSICKEPQNPYKLWSKEEVEYRPVLEKYADLKEKIWNNPENKINLIDNRLNVEMFGQLLHFLGMIGDEYGNSILEICEDDKSWTIEYRYEPDTVECQS